MEQVERLSQMLYKQILNKEQPKYMKYIAIAFGGCGLLILRNIFWKLWNKLQSYPPGPVGLPFLGCLLPYGASPRTFLMNIAKIYGPITYLPILASNNVFISSPKLLNKLYRNEKIIDRPEIIAHPKLWFMYINGKIWSKRRQYASTTMISITNTSFVLSNTEKCITKFIQPSLNQKANKNELWYPAQDIYHIIMNNVISAIFNKSLSFDDPFIQKYIHLTEKYEEKAPISLLVDLMFNLNITMQKLIKPYIIFDVTEEIDNVLIKWMENNGFVVDVKHNILQRKQKDNEDASKFYIDLLIKKLNENEITVIDIIADIQLMFMAAIDTTSKSSEYALILLAKYPDIQEMIYNELQSVMKVNNLKEFNFSIINKLHIFRAFIHESLRISSVVQTGIPHITNKDHIIEVNGKEMVIPKFTICHSNTYVMQRYLDWNDGNKILKKRNDEIHLDYWLYDDDDDDDDDGNNNKKFKMNENFILFGVGKRDCVGRSLAMKAMYAIFGLMINKYKFRAENNNPDAINIKQGLSFVSEIDPPIGIHVDRR